MINPLKFNNLTVIDFIFSDKHIEIVFENNKTIVFDITQIDNDEIDFESIKTEIIGKYLGIGYKWENPKKDGRFMLVYNFKGGNQYIKFYALDREEYLYGIDFIKYKDS